MLRKIVFQSKQVQQQQILKKFIHRQVKEKPITKDTDFLQYKGPTMDDMLVPSGSWKEYHSKRNKKYNIIFALGFISMMGSIYILKETVFFNAIPPPYPFFVEGNENENVDEDENEN